MRTVRSGYQTSVSMMDIAQMANDSQTYQLAAYENQNQRDKDHHQYVNTIHDRYEYVNPNNGQSYMYPNTQSQYPVVQNPDGTYTQLIPYQNH